LIATGDLNLVVVFCSVISGAALGDGLAFWLGYRYPSRVRKLWPLNKHQILVYQGEVFFQKYGKAAVLFARFLPPVRAFVPVTAGAMGMTPRQFYPINLVAILLWAPGTGRSGNARGERLPARRCDRGTPHVTNHSGHRGNRIFNLEDSTMV
jgi:membrane protein DedA with SNARE-associated domain